ncbi:MAG: hypothetical protein V3R64_08285 [Sphingomonadales bacterium]
MFRNFIAAFSAILTWTILVSSPVSSEESLGTWCLELVPGVPAANELIEIIQTDSGSYEGRWTSSDGTSFTQDLRELSPGVFSIIQFEQSSGDRLEILPGVLAAVDNQGLVAAGDSMELKQEGMDCWGN